MINIALCLIIILLTKKKHLQRNMQSITDFMLTHKNVTTTQIYADLVKSMKRETAKNISLK